ncbi:MAG: fumarylacetoacetase [Planctomycetes bacterium]|nr:fumarylacetoacetase [Planctomycetota bacterium]
MTGRSWIESANLPDADFPLHHLPWGRFERADMPGRWALGVAIGAMALDVSLLVEAGLARGLDRSIREALAAPSLNPLLALGRPAWHQARMWAMRLLAAEEPSLRDRADRTRFLVPRDQLRMALAMDVGDYTDFYASIHHATNVGSMFRPDNPLLPNWRHVPIGYHGRASTLVPSGTAVRRPFGQSSAADAGPPTFGPCRLFDYELEVGVVLGPGNGMGERIDIASARERLFGICLVNDWSARDIQKWEYVPLGPFTAKNFCTSVGAWITPIEAIEPWLEPGPVRDAGAPENLPYLRWKDDFTFDLRLQVLLRSARMREQGQPALQVSLGSYRDMYWTFAQMLTHHASTGCAMRPGDLLASGTVSGPVPESRGCLLERSWRGTQPLDLPDGSQRKFLEDGDEVILRGWFEPRGSTGRIGLGECRGLVLPALA